MAPVPATAPVSDPPTTAAALLAGADTAVDAGDLDLASRLFDRLLREHPGSTEAGQAQRALKIIGVRDLQAPSPSSVSAAPEKTKPGSRVRPSGPVRVRENQDMSRSPEEVVVRQEAYSTRTTERLRLTTWEKLDFGVTSFLYGMMAGFSFSLGSDSTDSGSATMPIALGALAYTLGAVTFLQVAKPDRGDLPLALAITSYVPTTTLLIANIAYDNPDDKKAALAVAGAGLLSIPIAIAATQKLNLDPGDTQLVRDAGFWGLMLGTFGTLGFGGQTTTTSFPGSTFESYQSPSTRTIASVAAIGLYGGLGLGVLAATQSEVSLERVRVTTWGGYGGGILGALMGLGVNGSEVGTYRGLTIGMLAGLIITFASTSGLDGIPPEDAPAPRASGSPLTPTLLSATGADGRSLPTFGLAGALP